MAADCVSVILTLIALKFIPELFQVPVAFRIGLSEDNDPWVINVEPFIVSTTNLFVVPSLILNVCDAPPVRVKSPVPFGSITTSPFELVDDTVLPSSLKLSTFHWSTLPLWSTIATNPLLAVVGLDWPATKPGPILKRSV